MIKGVNKQIIEVHDTQSQYYEKAYFVVRPEFSALQRDFLEKEARRIVKQAGAPSRFQKVIVKEKIFAAIGLASFVVSAVLVYASVSEWLG